MVSSKFDEGLNVFVDATLFFKLDESKLYDLYYSIGPNWYAYIVRCVYSAIKISTVDFSTEAFFNERVNISTAIQTNILTRLNNITYGAVILEKFEIRYIA